MGLRFAFFRVASKSRTEVVRSEGRLRTSESERPSNSPSGARRISATRLHDRGRTLILLDHFTRYHAEEIMIRQQHFMKATSVAFRVLPLLLTGLLFAGTNAVGAQAPSTASGRYLVRGNLAECVRRAEGAFAAEGFRVNGRGESWAYGVRSPWQGGVTCLTAPEGNTWAAVFVAGSGVTAASAGEQRGRLISQLGNPTAASAGEQRGRLISQLGNPTAAISAAPTPNSGGSARKLCGWTVSLPVYDKWQQLGGENGILGCAISDEKEAQSSPSGSSGTVVLFNKAGGALYHITTGRNMGRVHAVSAVIGLKFSELGDTGSWLGFPVGDQVLVPQGFRSNFEGGYIVWNRSMGNATAYRNNP
jgi:uncharacterized protein with LGFP repeats